MAHRHWQLFRVAILPMNMHNLPCAGAGGKPLYSELRAQGIEVLMDDRKERPGVMFADMELRLVFHILS